MFFPPNIKMEVDEKQEIKLLYMAYLYFLSKHKVRYLGDWVVLILQNDHNKCTVGVLPAIATASQVAQIIVAS